MQSIINYFTSLPASTYYHTAEWFVSSSFLSALILAITHYRGKFEKVTKRFKVTLMGLLSFLVAAATAYVGSGVNLGTLGKNGLAIAGGLTLIYHIAASPLYKKYVLKLGGTTPEPPLAPESPVAPAGQLEA